MAIKTKPFDAAKYITTPEAEEVFLSEALATNHPGHIANALGVIARARGMSALAAETGINRATLYASLQEGGNPTLDTLIKVLSALKLQLGAKQLKTA